jgi:hypothetical protein
MNKALKNSQMEIIEVMATDEGGRMIGYSRHSLAEFM